MKEVYKLASQAASKSSCSYKAKYDQKICGGSIGVGDRVLVKKVVFKGKHKITNRWEEDLFYVKKLPNKDILVFVVERKVTLGVPRMLHTNIRLPVNFVPFTQEEPEKVSMSTTKTI